MELDTISWHLKNSKSQGGEVFVVLGVPEAPGEGMDGVAGIQTM